jgi:hypothetical protein
MDRKTAKLIREFCEIAEKPYRQFKKAYLTMNADDKCRAKKELAMIIQNNRKIEKVRGSEKDLHTMELSDEQIAERFSSVFGFKNNV